MSVRDVGGQYRTADVAGRLESPVDSPVLETTWRTHPGSPPCPHIASTCKQLLARPELEPGTGVLCNRDVALEGRE